MKASRPGPRLFTRISPLIALAVVAGLCAPAAWAQPAPNAGDGYLTDGTELPVLDLDTPTCFATQFWEHVPEVQRGVFDGANVPGIIQAGLRGFVESTFLTDVDADGNLDVLWVYDNENGPGPNNGTYTWLGNGDGTFQTEAIRDIGSFTGGPLFPNYMPAGGASAAESTYVADVNGDGIVDIVWIWDASHTANAGTWVWLGNGDGTFVHTPIEDHGHDAGRTFAFPAFGGYTDAFESTHLVDVNNDGALDIIWVYDHGNTNNANNGTWVWLGNGDGTFQTAVNETLGFQGGPGLAWGAQGGQTGNETTRVVDVDRDGSLDILWTWDGAGNAFHSGSYVYRGNGDGSFDPAPLRDVGGFGGATNIADLLQAGISGNESTLVGDLDGDGMLDLLWVWDGSGTAANSGTWVWRGKDTDGDGLADVVDDDDDGDGVPDASDSCTAPGGIDPDLQLWLKADVGLVAEGPDTVTHWADQAPAARDANLVFGDAQRIGGGVNFNPTVQFDGNDWLRFAKSPFAHTFTAGEVFTVLKDLSPGVGDHGHTLDFGSANRNSHYTWSNGAVYDGFGTNNRLGWNPVTGAIVDPKPGVTSISGPSVSTDVYHLYRVHSATNDWGVSLDGIATAATSTNTVSFALTGGNEHVGAVSGFRFHGEMAEVILYDRTLAADERVQVESYLATKYGITLGHDYVSSEETVYWDAAANADYHNDVAGIGRDDATGLQQKQSASINAQNFLAVGLGLIAEDNPSNPNAFDADDMFLVWGHDGTGVAARDPVDVPEPFDERLGRVWKAANTGGVSGVAVRFTLAPFIYDSGNAADYALLISDTPTFAGATAVPGTLAAGTITFDGVTLADGQFFTLAVPQRPEATPTPEAPDFVHIQEGVGTFAWFNRGDGTFFTTCQVAGTWPAHPPGIGDLVAAENVVYIDANGDGIRDAVHGLEVGAPAIRVYLGNGDGTFAMPPIVTPPPTRPPGWGGQLAGNGVSDSSFAVDVNGDGIPDWVSSREDVGANSGIAVWPGIGDGTFAADPIVTTGFSLPTGTEPQFAGVIGNQATFLIDVTGDAVLDWVTSADAYGANSAIAVWPGNGDGTFQTTPITTVNPDKPAGWGGDFTGEDSVQSTALIDATGDGIPDFIHSNDSVGASSGVAVWAGNGDGTFDPAPIVTTGFTLPAGWSAGGFAGTAGVQATLVRDVNNDGQADYLSTVDSFGASSGIAVWPGNGDGTFTTTPVASSGFSPGFRTGTDGIQVSRLVAGLQDLCAPDFGDAPASYGTLFADGGAHHTVPGFDAGGNTAPLMLGARIDLENDGFPGPDADGDDQSNFDDEDGVAFPPLAGGQAATLEVTVANTGPAAVLNAWADWDGDGHFADVGEQIAADLGVTAGVNDVPVTVPQIAQGLVYFRFRLSTQGGLGPAGPAPDGEVEDYVVTISPQADLAIAKSAGQGTYVPGAPFTYTLVVTNNGPSNATGFSVEDVVPAAITGVSASCAPAGAASCGTDASSGNTVSFTDASLEAGAGNSLTITINGTVGVDTTGDLTNTGTVTPAPDQPDPDTGNNSSTVVTGQGAGEADLAIAKTDGQAGYVAGTPISYTVTVTNLGPSNASLVDVVDVVPAEITGVSASCVASGAATCGTDTSSGNTVSFTGGSLEAGAGNELVITIDGTIDPDFTDGDLVNTAEVRVPGGADYSDPDLGNNTATDTNTPLPQEVDLAITKDDGQEAYVPGAAISYTLTVTNAGPSTATGFRVEDAVPAAITDVSASCTVVGQGDCGSDVSSGNSVAFDNATLSPGAGNRLVVTVEGTVSPDATGDLVNDATVAAAPDATETDPANDSDSDTDTQGDGLADLAISKTNGQAGYVAGTQVTYTITVTNAGPSHAPSFDLTDSVPPMIGGLTVDCTATGAASCGSDDTTGNDVAFSGASLEAGAGNELVITITGTIDPGFFGGDIVNTAQVAVPDGLGYSDPELGNNSATDVDTPLPQQVDLTITKDDGQAEYVPGAPITYTLEVTNAGPSTATDVEIADPLPAGITGVTASCFATGAAGCGTNESAGNAVSFTNATIAPGAGNSLTITVEGTVTPGTTGDLVNAAMVTEGNGAEETNPDDNAASDTDTQGAGVADLSVSKTDGQAAYTAGTAISYQIVVANAGPSHAVGFDVADTVPAAITDVAVSCTVTTGVGDCGTDNSSGNTVSFIGVSLNAGAELTYTVDGTIDPSATGDLVNTAEALVPGGAGFSDPDLANNSATDTDTEGTQEVDLTVTKDDGQSEYVPGTPVSYTITITNAGPSTATGVTVEDSVPASILDLAVSCAVTGVGDCGSEASSGHDVLFVNASLEPGAGNELVYTISGTISPDAAGDLVNTATVEAGAGAEEANTGDNSATDTDTQGTPEVDLAVAKTDGQSEYMPGTAISYTITVTNAGPSASAGFSFADTVPAAITGVSVTCAVTGDGDCGTDASAGNDVSFTDLALAPGAGNQLTFTVGGTIDPAASGDLINTATVAAGADETDTDPGNDSATDTDTQGTSEVDLGVTKDDGQDLYVPGTAISYTVVVTNAGPATALVFSLADTVPAAISEVSVSCAVTGGGSCGIDGSSGNDIAFTDLALAPGAGNQLTFIIDGVLDPNASGDLANTVTVVAGAGSVDTDPSNDSATDLDSQGTSEVDLGVTKDDGQDEYVPGAPITYTIVVTNAGPSAATGFGLTDSVPLVISDVVASCAVTGSGDCGSNDSSGNTVSFSGLSLDPGVDNQLVFTIDGTVAPDASGDLENTVTVTPGDATDTEPGNDSATDTDLQGASQVDLAVTKDDGQTEYVAGTPITYTVVVTNAGPSAATDFGLADTVPAAINDVTASCEVTAGNGSCGTDTSSGNDVSFTGLSLGAGAGNELTFTIAGTIDSGASGNLSNTVTAIAGSGSTDVNPGNNDATDVDTRGTGEADLGIVKDDGETEYVPGTAVVYTLTVTNAGPSDAPAVDVSDAVPATISGVAVSCTASGAASCGTDESVDNEVSFTGASIPAGAGNQLAITISGTVDADATGELVNTAGVVVPDGADYVDPNFDNNTSTDTNAQGVAQVDLAVTKDDGQDGYVPGAPITYTLTVTNAGPSTATGFSIADAVPAAITGVSASCAVVGFGDCGSDASTGNNVQFDDAMLAPGTGNRLVVTVEGTVSPDTTGDLANTATVTAGAGSEDTEPSNDSATDTDGEGAGEADLAITKTDGEAGYIAGTPVSYTLTVTNLGPSHAPSLDVHDTVPPMILGVAVSCTATGAADCGTDESSGNQVAFTGASLDAGAGNELVITIDGTVDPGFIGGNIVNAAEVSVPDGAGYDDPQPDNNTAMDTNTPLPQQVDLTITKDDGQSEYVPGAPVSYTLTVTNAGPSTASDVRIEDPVPAEITDVVVSCVPTGVAACGSDETAGNAVAFTNATINPGAGNFLTITINGVVSPDATGDLANMAMATEGNGADESNPDDNVTGDTDAEGAGVADLVVTKTDGRAIYTPGTAITYQIRVANDGPSHADGFDIDDVVPTAITGVGVSCAVTTGAGDCGTDASSGNTVAFSGAVLEVGSILTVTVTGTIDANATGDLVNTATATVSGGAGYGDPDPDNNAATDTDTQGAQEIDLAITKDDGQDAYVPGTPISYTLTVTNAGPSTATGFSVEDAVPAAIADVVATCAVTGTGDCGSNDSTGNDVAFNGMSLEPGGDELVITISGTIAPDAVGDVVNTATVTAGAGAEEANTGNNSATDFDIMATPEVDLAIAKDDGQSEYVPGTAIAYTVTVTNAGPSTALAFSVEDTVPAMIEGVSATCAVTGTAECGSNESSGNDVSFTGLRLAPGAGNQLTFTISGVLDPGASGDLVNTATVTPGPDSTDTNPDNDSATDTDGPGVAQVDLAITKVSDQTEYVPGTPITYTLTVTNDGPSDATGVTVTDSVPTAIDAVEASCVAGGSASCGTDESSGNVVEFTDAAIAVGGGNSLTITITGVIDSGATGDLVNTAMVSAGAGSIDVNPSDNSATDTVAQGTGEADLAIDKDNGQEEYLPGDPVTYTVTVLNMGPSDASPIDVRDLVPSAITGVAATCVANGVASCGSNDSTGNNVQFNGASIVAGAGNSLVITIAGTIDEDFADDLVNTARVLVPDGADYVDPQPANNESTDIDTMVPPEILTPVAMEVDPEPLMSLSDGNDIFEPDERVVVAPAWRNDGERALGFSGTASSYTGPEPAEYNLVLDFAQYGTADPDEVTSCREQGEDVCYEMEALQLGGQRPAAHWDAEFVETLDDREETTKTWLLHIGDSFVDAPKGSIFYPFIEKLVHVRGTVGCEGRLFCPGAPAPRAHMAVFVLRALEGRDYIPPACVAGEERFDDVPASSVFCRFIEELVRRDAISGCDSDSFCPFEVVSRQQAAVFLLNTLEGPGYEPPACSGIFADLPCSSPFAAWAEDLIERGITTGCTEDPLRYCPGEPLTRAQAATLVTRTFDLTLYGP